MANRDDSSQPCAPSQFHLAFALALVKQKPPDKEVKEYIMEMRRFIHDDMEVTSPDKFFDSVGFWQNAYQRSEAEQTKLLNTIFELEQRVQSFHSKIKDNRMNTGSPPAKRKFRLPDNENGRGTPAKKTQASAAATKPPIRQGNQDSDADEDNEATLKLLRQIHIVQSDLKKKKTPTSLVREAVTLCKVAELEIIEAIIHSTQPKAHPNQQAQRQSLSSVIRAVQLAFNLSHQALHKITGSQDWNQGKVQIIYYLVCLFQSTMTALAQNCAAASVQANPKKNPLHDTSNANRMPPRDRLGKFAKAKAPPMSKTSDIINNINEVAQQLINLLCGMTRSLDLKRPEDQEIMEGIIFVAIERVGKILALFTFNDRKNPSDAFPDLTAPQGLTAMREEAMTPEMVQLEAKYLVIFLEQLLCPELTNTEAVQPEFLRNAKLRFQRTLLQTVFGNDDPLFQQGLGRPRTPPALSSNRGDDGQDFSEWFTGELWRLVGWDILNSAPKSWSV